MKNLILTYIFSTLLLITTPAAAEDGFIEANTHVLVGDGKVVTAEYAWAKGRGWREPRQFAGGARQIGLPAHLCTKDDLRS